MAFGLRGFALSDLPGLIFTFAPESTVLPEFISSVTDTIARAGGRLDFVEPTCPMPELKRRIGDASRRDHGKITSVCQFEQLLSAGVFNSPVKPKPAITIDTSVSRPTQAAAQI